VSSLNLSIYPTPVILITGVSGFLGRYIARYFYNQAWVVIGIDNSSPENAPLSTLTIYKQLQLPNTSLHLFLKETQPTVCIHCAGRASVGLSLSHPLDDFYENTVLTFEILNALRLNSPKCQFLFLSSAAVYGNPVFLPIQESDATAPISPYGFHKLQSEQLRLEFSKVYGLPVATLRIFSAYGPGLRRQVIWDVCQKAITLDKILIQGTGQESRDFIHALDIARAMEVVIQKAPLEGEAYNLAMGKEVKIKTIAQLILSALGLDKPLEFDGIVPPGNPLNWQADISKLKILGFVPKVSLEKGITAFSHWCKTELLSL